MELQLRVVPSRALQRVSLKGSLRALLRFITGQ